MKFITSSLFIVFLCFVSIVQAQNLSCKTIKSQLATNSLYYSPENKRSDTINVLKYTINLDITDFTGKTITGNTKVKFAPKINNQTILRLDLLKMTIDSIKQNNAILSYTYNDTLLNVNLSSALNNTDTSEVTVYYHGVPQGDPAGWGGFSFNGNYAYNLGVGFGANPHNYGRVWFPCFDNFVEKSKYEFNILTDTLKTAYCNGYLSSDTRVGNKRLHSWILNDEIPTYLASVAVADYKQVNWSVNAANGNLPIVLAARAADTTALKNGFIHLPNAILGFENFYGPYVWNRVGYCLVPFNSGAMEHATNIAYPQAATGIANEADLMAHELSHHWWGDLMTCETQEDMWLNEGMASYSERLFLEWVYGYDRYIAQVKNIHNDLVKYLHLNESGFRAISGVPHSLTYSDHVYKKGADVAHTLRAYMGDTAFFNGLKYVLQQKAFKNMNSLEFRDLLQTSSGKNLTDFFNNWVLNGGWPHFSIDSVITVGATAPYTHTVHVKQKLFGAPSLYNNVPLELTFMNQQWNKEIKIITMNGGAGTFTLQTAIKPNFVGINVDSKISDAISSEYKTIKSTGTITYTLGNATLLVSDKGQDSSYIRIEHNFAAPDPIKNNTNNYRLNTQHYWKVDGLLSPNFNSKLRFNYNGNKVKSGIGYLDTCLTQISGDSIILLYRKNAGDDWKEVKHYTKFRIATRLGYFTVDTLKFGEYVFANGTSSVLTDVKEHKQSNITLTVYPNPAQSEVYIVVSVKNKTKSQLIEVFDSNGRVVYHSKDVADNHKIDVSNLSSGFYQIRLLVNDKEQAVESFVIER